MQYRYEIEHAPAMLAPAEGRTVVLTGIVCEGVLLCTYILYKNLVISTESLYKSYKIYVKKSSKSA